MATPALSFIVPAHPSGAELVRRFLRSLAYQTADPNRFEVVIGADGGDDGRLAAVADGWPFAVRVVDSPRTHVDVPHRNHARNQALRQAAGRFAWVVDADFVWEAHAIEHALAVMLGHEARGEVVAISPTLWAIDSPPEVWEADTAEWAAGDETMDPADLVAKYRTRGDVYAGFSEHYAAGGKPALKTLPLLHEGFPCAPLALFKALRCFDEAFIGWGGNKEELTRRLNHLTSQGVEYRLLTTVRAWHQPHPADAQKTHHDPLRRANQQRFIDKIREVRAGAAPWWREQLKRVAQVVERARRAVRGVAAERGELAAAPAARTVVGLVGYGDPKKGIARDMEIVADCLTGGAVRPGGGPDPGLDWYMVLDVPTFRDTPLQSTDANGRTWQAFVKAVDVVIISELVPVAGVDAALAAGCRVVLIPNADWAQIGGSVDRFVQVVGDYAKRPDGAVQVWAKTPAFAAELQRRGIKPTPIPWATLDPVVRDRRRVPQAGEPVRFFASLGMGGWQGRRGVDIILKAWGELAADPGEATLTLKTIKPLAKMGVPASAIPDGVQVVEAFWSRKQAQAAWLDYDVTLYPTRWDGYGLSAAESLDAGTPVLAPDAWPMREHVQHEHNGLIFGAPVTGTTRLAPKCEPDAGELAKAMRRLIDDRDLLERITAPHPGERLARQLRFRMAARRLVLQERAPVALIVQMRGHSRDGVRSEAYWRGALEAAGYRVEVLDQDNLHASPVLAVDFALVAKLTPEEVDHVRRVVGRAPVVCWHHDLTDFEPRRYRWQREIVRLVDLALVPEGDLARFSDIAGGDVRTVFPGTKAGAGPLGVKRPAGLPGPADGRPAVVFLGSYLDGDHDRVDLLRALRKAKVQLDVRGDRWDEVEIDAAPYVSASGDSGAVYAGQIALCHSRGGHTRFYTSNRLFNAAGAGAVPLVRIFPGLEKLYPDGTVLPFEDVGEAVKAVRALRRKDGEARLRAVQVQAVQHTWRHHTWQDRIVEVISMAKDKDAAPVVQGGQFAQMWHERGAALGERAVGHIADDERQHAKATQVWWAKLQRHIAARLKAYDVKVLDFGCGVGRFTRLINAIDGKRCTGVDVAPSMVEMAIRADPQGDYRVVNPAKLPFPDEHFDALWTCTVLQHIPDAEIGAVVAELRRVLKRDGVLVLFENTHRHTARTSGSGHVVFRRDVEYQTLFPGAVPVETIDVRGERHTVFAGRLSVA